MGNSCNCINPTKENKNTEITAPLETMRERNTNYTEAGYFSSNERLTSINKSTSDKFNEIKKQLLKEIFNKINEVRFNPGLFSLKAKSFGIENIIGEAAQLAENGERVEMFLYDNEKYSRLFENSAFSYDEITSNGSQNKKYAFDNYSNQIDLDYKFENVEDMAEYIVLNLLSKLEYKEQRNFLIKRYKHCNVDATEKSENLIDVKISFIYSKF
ncbi:MAG: hypothetical protein MJ252_14200 [archaeon]|nr:hypothetical protein [archaeon]